MKTAKNLVTRGFFVMVLTLMAMTAIDMAGNGTVSGVKVAQAKTHAKKGKIKIPKNAKKKERKAAKELNKLKCVAAYTWKKGRLVQLELSVEFNTKKKFKPAHLKAFTGLTDLNMIITSNAWKRADFSKYKNLKKLELYDWGYMKKINLTKNKKLTDLTIHGSIEEPSAAYNGIKKSVLNKLDLSGNKRLKNLDLEGFPLKKLDLTNNKNLEKLVLKSLLIHSLASGPQSSDPRAYEPKTSQLGLAKNLKELTIENNNKLLGISLDGLSSLTFMSVYRCDKLRVYWMGGCNKLKSMSIHNCNKLNKCSVLLCSGLNFMDLDDVAESIRINVSVCPNLPPHDGTTTGIHVSGKWNPDNESYEYPTLYYDGKTYYFKIGDLGGDWELKK